MALLELSGKSDHEITKLLDAADKRGDLGIDAFVPQRIQDYIDKAAVNIKKFIALDTAIAFSTTFFAARSE